MASPCAMRLPTLAVEPLILEIEIARDAQPDVVRDPARPAELEHGRPLGLEQLVAQPLEVLRAHLDPVLVVAEPGAEAVGTEPVRAAQALRGVRSDPLLL